VYEKNDVVVVPFDVKKDEHANGVNFFFRFDNNHTPGV